MLSADLLIIAFVILIFLNDFSFRFNGMNMLQFQDQSGFLLGR